MMTFDDARGIALSYEGVEEGLFFGHPIFRIRKKSLGRLWDDDIHFVIRVTDIEYRDMLLEVEPATFFITPHFRNYPYLLARPDVLEPDQYRGLFEATWRQQAPKTLVKAHDARLAGRG